MNKLQIYCEYLEKLMELCFVFEDNKEAGEKDLLPIVNPYHRAMQVPYMKMMMVAPDHIMEIIKKTIQGTQVGFPVYRKIFVEMRKDLIEDTKIDVDDFLLHNYTMKK